MLREKVSGSRSIITVAVTVILLLTLVALAFGRGGRIGSESATPITQISQVLEPEFSNYRGIAIGTTETELLERINIPPMFESEDDYFYVFSAAESAQFLLDEERKVKLISITYSGDTAGAPTYESVFGRDVALSTPEAGRSYNLVNYPAAGFWVSYYRSIGDRTVVTVTIQKL